MKRFLYYNQDAVNSLLAQIEQGLLVSEQSGEEEGTTHSETLGIKADLSGDLSAKLFGIGAALKGEIHADDIDTNAATTLIRSVHEKVLHDYAFEKVYEYVMENNLVNNTDPKIGDIVLVTDTPTFLDFTYFELLFSDDGAVKYINEQNKKQINEKIDEIKKEVPKGTKIPVPIQMQIDAAKTEVANAEPQRKELQRTIKVLRNTVPYNRFLMTENMLIPMDDEYFRDNPDIVAFKYGGKMSILGYVTNILIREETPSSNNNFASYYDSVNKVMLELFNDQDTVYIIHPVALFY